ncbi:hypothetical protein KCU95_g13936, partial [Aureobasidium melanogenum]
MADNMTDITDLEKHTIARRLETDIIMKAATLQTKIETARAPMEKEAEGDEGIEGNEESVVPVHLRVRRYPEPTLGRDRYCYGSGIAPEGMEVPQYLLLDLFSRSRAQGVVVLAEQWRTTQQYIAAWRASINGPTTRDSMFPGFTKQMVICLKAEATDNMSQVFNLIEHVGLANELSKALSTISNTHGDNYQTYVAWRRQQERRGGSLDSYGSFRKFIIHQAVTTLFGHEPESTAVNLKLVNSLVRRAEVLRALELAFGPGVFVLLLGFTGSSEKAWNEGTEAILKTLPNSCPMRRRVCNLANKNIWSKVVNNEQLYGPKLDAELRDISDRGNKDLLTLLSPEGEEITEDSV